MSKKGQKGSKMIQKMGVSGCIWVYRGCIGGVSGVYLGCIWVYLGVSGCIWVYLGVYGVYLGVSGYLSAVYLLFVCLFAASRN